MRLLKALTLGLVIVSSSCIADTGVPHLAASLIDVVERRFSADDALETVHYLDRFWRHPGNTGYDAGIDRLVALLEQAGYVDETLADANQRLVYRIESSPSKQLTWEPVDARLSLVGYAEPLLEFSTNRNMLAIYSASTPPEAVEAQVVHVGSGSVSELDAADVKDKIVFADAHPTALTREAMRRGAVGVLAYWIPSFNRPQVNQEAIVHEMIQVEGAGEAWTILLSTRARNALKVQLEKGSVRARVNIKTKMYAAHARHLVAEVRGSTVADERFMFSAHLQEPGANDNGSGVAALAEIADVAAQLVRDDMIDPGRTLTFLWGAEFASVADYLRQDSKRAQRVLWGLSLDMVGQNTALTGGSFLIEKMPDPSAIWTRGEDQHSDWGGEVLAASDMRPHHFNDVAISVCSEVGRRNDWLVKTNPFEGGSDHEPFLHAGRPGLLFWHFTDQFYHTDLDRPDKVSGETMRNVATCALASALLLTTADERATLGLLRIVTQAALWRLAAELELSRAAVEQGADVAAQQRIVEAWVDWYSGALRSLNEVQVGGSSPGTQSAIDASIAEVRVAGDAAIRTLVP